MLKNELCCSAPSKKTLDGNYWNSQYEANTLGWDLGEVSPPLKSYIDQIRNKDTRILIPGCGNTYEADYLVAQGFTNITIIDIAPLLVDQLRKRFEGNQAVTVILGDFFQHSGTYDLILEQTFFCALPPSKRTHYVAQMHALLANGGRLCGVLFNRTFEAGPPFGGDTMEYTALFRGAFDFLHFEPCYNSALPRAGSELFIELAKRSDVVLQRFAVQGITGSEAMQTLTGKVTALPDVISAVMNNGYDELLLVSRRVLSLQEMLTLIEYDATLKLHNIEHNLDQHTV